MQVEQQALHMVHHLDLCPQMVKKSLKKTKKKGKEEMIYVKSVVGREKEKDGRLCR